MSLAALLATSAHATLADPLKAEYRAPTEDEVKATPALKDHMILDVTPAQGFALDNVDMLRTTVGTQKGRADRAEAKVAAFGDLKPEEVTTRLTRLTELEALDPAKEADKIALAKIETAKREMADANKADLDKANARADRYKGSLDRTLRVEQAQKAIGAAGGNAEALLPHVLNNLKFNETDDGKFTVQVVDGDGNPRIGDAAGNPMTLTQLVEEFKAKDSFAPLFSATGASGGGGAPPGGGGGAPPAGTLKRSEMDNNTKADYIEKHGQQAYLSLAS